MSTITATDVKKLRDQTGAGMMECKAALTEASGDFEEANLILRKRGLASAAKKAGRATSEGVVGHSVSADHRSGILVEVNCETDFVAKTPDFQGLVKDLSMQVAAADFFTVKDRSGENPLDTRNASSCSVPTSSGVVTVRIS